MVLVVHSHKHFWVVAIKMGLETLLDISKTNLLNYSREGIKMEGMAAKIPMIGSRSSEFVRDNPKEIKLCSNSKPRINRIKINHLLNKLNKTIFKMTKFKRIKMMQIQINLKSTKRCLQMFEISTISYLILTFKN